MRDAQLRGIDPGARGGLVNGLLQATERVDQTVLYGIAAEPDPALCQRIDLVDGHVAALGHTAQEPGIGVVGKRLQGSALGVGQRRHAGDHVGVGRGGHTIRVDTDFFTQERIQVEKHHEHADRTRDGRCLGHDHVAPGCQPVAAACRHITHRYDNRDI